MLIAVKDFIPSFSFPSPPDLEVISVIIGQGNDFVVCCIYIPPEASPSYVSSLVSYLSSLTCSFNKCTILGDFNLPDVDWYTLTGSSSSSSYFCNFIFD